MPIAEFLRPWKLFSFAVGLGLLLIGADFHAAPDWDAAISLIMATLTYLTAPWSVQVIRDRRWRWVPLALFWYYFAVDGSYWLYWQRTNPEALAMRPANFLASSCLYWLCGLLWLHRGPLRTLVRIGPAPATDGAPPLTVRRAVARLLTALMLFWMAYSLYSFATGEVRMTQTCQHIRPGMDIGQLLAFAERQGLGPRPRVDTEVRARTLYLAEGRTLGRHACRVELEQGKVRRVAYSYAD